VAFGERDHVRHDVSPAGKHGEADENRVGGLPQASIEAVELVFGRLMGAHNSPQCAISRSDRRRD
jgi:hypothetical protein